MFIQAPAQPPCFPHADLARALAEGHDEHPVGNGAAGNGAAVMLFVSRDGSSWTLVIRRGSVSCIATSGTDWSTLHVEPPKPPGQGA